MMLFIGYVVFGFFFWVACIAGASRKQLLRVKQSYENVGPFMRVVAWGLTILLWLPLLIMRQFQP